VRVDNIGRTGARKQLADPLAILLAESLNTHPRQHARKVGLLAAITPDLAHNRGARPHRRSPPLEHAQLGAYHTVTTINGDQCSGVEHRLHATSERGARPS
jgi:hypothetical protein